MDPVKIVPVRLVNDYEKNFAESFQSIVKLALDTFPQKGWTGADLLGYKKFKRELMRYSNYPFAQSFIKKIKEWDKEFIEVFQAKRQPQQKTEIITNAADKLQNLFFSGQINAALAYSKTIEKTLKDVELRGKNIKDVVGDKRNPLYIENPLFFGRNGLLEQFTKEDMENIINKNLDVYKWTYMPLPESKISDYEFIVHWIYELKNTPENVKLSYSEFKRYAEFIYNTDDFEKLKKALDEYLHSNNKKYIPIFLELLNKIPDLNETNNDQKNKITLVYRGIVVEEETNKKSIIEQEKINQIVATSKSYYTAKKFAYQIGHLESIDNRRSENGAIITYEVNPESILIDTSILGGIFGESEVLINVAKSKIKKIDFV